MWKDDQFLMLFTEIQWVHEMVKWHACMPFHRGLFPHNYRFLIYNLIPHIQISMLRYDFCNDIISNSK
jgi:hypothetical protein